MAGMEALGRLFNVIPVAAGAPFKCRGASSYTFVAYNGTGSTTTTVTLQAASSFGGSYSNLYAIKNIYTTTALNGTAAWTKQTAYPYTSAPWATGGSGGSAGPIASFTFNNSGQNFPTAVCCAFTVFTSEFSDPTDYLECNITGSGGLVIAIPCDLTVQRNPANLEIQGA
jgi:hypothetical protein